MSLFRKIDYSKMLLESLRNYFSVNKAGNLSILYRVCLAILYPLQLAWNDLETYRAKIWLISQCKWQLGQLQNVLRILYDNTNTLYITQAVTGYIFAPTFANESNIYEPTFASESTIYEKAFNDLSLRQEVIFNIPSALASNTALYNDFISTIEKIRLLGINYSINVL